MGIFKRVKPVPEAKKVPQPGLSAEAQADLQRELIKIVGHRGAPNLVALFQDDQPNRVVWMAIPSWESYPEIEESMNNQAPPGWHARAAGFDEAMPSLWIPLRDMFANGVEESSVRIGVTENWDWVEWNLPFDKPDVPSVASDSRIWKVAH